uniref:Uncharacterized protein n=1 Tax=Ixodes scapularis TaxID=6945 RepID=A0A4D5RXF6_IXOSC
MTSVAVLCFLPGFVPRGRPQIADCDRVADGTLQHYEKSDQCTCNLVPSCTHFSCPIEIVRGTRVIPGIIMLCAHFGLSAEATRFWKKADLPTHIFFYAILFLYCCFSSQFWYV